MVEFCVEVLLLPNPIVVVAVELDGTDVVEPPTADVVEVLLLCSPSTIEKRPL